MTSLLIWVLSQPLVWAVTGTLAGPFLFYRGFRLLQLKRRISNVPRSTIRAAAVGPVEVSGTAMGPYTLVSPLNQCDCLYYKLVVESNPQGDLKDKINELCAPLYINDGTGTLMVYPHGSELRLKPSAKRTDYFNLALMIAARTRGELPEFSQEYTIKRGDKIFVLGTIQVNTSPRKEPSSDPDDCSRIGPGFLSAAEADLQRRDEFPLLSAFAPVGVPDTSREFDLNPPVVMAKANGPFVISKDSQSDLLTKLSWRSLVCIWGGPLAALWGLWELLVVRPGIVGSVLR
jgi:hypothetical protein